MSQLDARLEAEASHTQTATCQRGFPQVHLAEMCVRGGCGVRASGLPKLVYSPFAAVLESQAFGPYKQPDYQALLEKNNAAVLREGETLQRNVTGSDAGVTAPENGKSSGT